ncbi:MAG: hypothetical protein Q4G50_05215 [Corynebacterium sp.]|uniref:hypothetical protein n=1 Tax=Corynebacterium sp. TaxID=1720 RepID=UPI0026DF3988|nr:hypothetical protein [Corynebacterium sp.]MDO5669382.1 hypothetical protein [Corynebacterium sp.]
MTPEQFGEMVNAFHERTHLLLDNCFDAQPEIVNHTLGQETFRAALKISVSLASAHRPHPSAELVVSYQIGLDRMKEHLAIDSSQFSIRLLHSRKAVPVVRYEYERQARNSPSAHLHVHADSVPLALSLERNGRGASGYEQSKLHFPTGGHRFRICLEDVIQFAIDELGFLGRDGWRTHVEQGRAEFRRKQAETVIRHHHALAAENLRALGYTVTDSPDTTSIPSAREGW